MPAIHRLFAATILAGTVSVLAPSPAKASTTPTGPSPTLAEPAPAQPKPASTSVETAIIGAAATEIAADESIRPFRFHATDEQLADLKRRIRATNWPEKENDPTQGVNLATIQKLAAEGD